MSTSGSRIEAPFSPPDVQWVNSSDLSTPEGAIVCGQLNGEPVYAGRVYFENHLLIGSVDLKKQKCTFSLNGTVHESSDFELLTVPVGEPIGWEKMQPDTPIPKKNLLNSGKLENSKILYIGRIVEGDNTRIGWVDLKEKVFHVAEDGSEKTYQEYEMAIHKFLQFLCICPPCPPRGCKKPSSAN